MKPNKENITLNDLGAFTSKLQEKDKKYATQSKRLQYVYWFLIPFYLILGTYDYIFDGTTVKEFLSQVSFAIAMLVFALTFRKLAKEYNFVDYSEPTLTMLKKVVKRYTPFHGNSRWVFVALIFLDAGLCLKRQFDKDLLHIQIVFLGAIAISICVGLILWLNKYKPIRDAAKQLINDIEMNN
ncbi:hypothetical protein [Plebeiibacterium sediminum]|uniref:Uncharacterized protein n=1 Tax=Plebeiibacterium sediminum TaxID=2992112 RepID=A0AAE3M923_9BACT|nr:hypothetical protein [Plebeiobacterium sediminum]MCW3789159.1 hypothetical protein [Plebeiobacterium sediminum]